MKRFVTIEAPGGVWGVAQESQGRPGHFHVIAGTMTESCAMRMRAQLQAESIRKHTGELADEWALRKRDAIADAVYESHTGGL